MPKPGTSCSPCTCRGWPRCHRVQAAVGRNNPQCRGAWCWCTQAAPFGLGCLEEERIRGARLCKEGVGVRVGALCECSEPKGSFGLGLGAGGPWWGRGCKPSSSPPLLAHHCKIVGTRKLHTHHASNSSHSCGPLPPWFMPWPPHHMPLSPWGQGGACRGSFPLGLP